MRTTRNVLIVVLMIAAIGLAAGAAQAAEWKLDGNGNWNVDGNWVNPATFPNAIDAVADFSKLNITNHRTVNVEQDIIIGSMLFGDTNSTHDYNLQRGAAGTLTFDVSSGYASIVKTTGRDQHIYAPITLNDNLDVTNNGSGALYLRGGVNNNGYDVIFDGSGWTRFQDATAGISGSGNVIKNGSGVLILGNGGTVPTHTYTGQTIVNGGVVMFQAANKAAGNFTLNNGMLTDYYRNTTIFSGGLGTGNNQIRIYGDSGFGGGNGNSNWRIGAQNSILQWGSTYFNPTSLKFLTPADNMGPSIYGQVTLQNGLDLNGGARTIYVLAATGPNIVNSWGKIDGVINDTVGGGSLIKTGGGQLVLNNTNTFTGGVEISGGTVQVGNNSGLGNGGPLSFSGSGTKLDLRASPTVGNLSGTSNYGLITAGAAGARVLTVNQTANTTLGGVIENGLGTVSLVKSGSGSLTLAGASTYTGATTVSAGTLRADGSIAASSMTTVNSGGTLSGSGTVGPLALQGGTVSPGSSVGTLAAGATTWTDGSRLLFEIDDANGTAGAAGGPGWDLLNIAGTLDLSGLSTGGFTVDINTLLPGGGTSPGAMANFLDSSSYSWEFVRTTGGLVGAFDAGDFLLDTSEVANAYTGAFGVSNVGNSLFVTYTGAAIIPEPSTFVLAALGLLVLIGFGRRRRRH